MAKRYPKETKEEVLKKIREGQRVSDVTKAYGIKFSPSFHGRLSAHSRCITLNIVQPANTHITPCHDNTSVETGGSTSPKLPKIK